MITFDRISVRRGHRQILSDVSFSAAPHEFTVIIGKNGSGKSTLLSCLTGSVPYAGEISCAGRSLAQMPLRERSRLLAVLPQILPRTALTVEELTGMGRNPYLDPGKHLGEADRRQIENAMRTVGIAELRSKPVTQLSGGERQKAFLAMVLAQDTPLLVLDEPTTYMDMENEADFLSLLQTLKTAHGKTLLVVMHDLTKAVEIADRVVVLDSGRCIFSGSAQACEASGVIEKSFHVQRGFYEKDGVLKTLYYR